MKRLLKRWRTRRPCVICDENAQLDSLCWQHAQLRLWRNNYHEGVANYSDWEPMQLGKHPQATSHVSMQTSAMVAKGRAQRLRARPYPDMQTYSQMRTELSILLAKLGVGLDDTGADSPADRYVSGDSEDGVTA